MEQRTLRGLLTDILHALMELQLLSGLKKEVLTSREAAAYLGISQNTLNHYKSEGLISYHKPNGRLDYFKREDLEAFALKGRIEAEDGIKKKALDYMSKTG